LQLAEFASPSWFSAATTDHEDTTHYQRGTGGLRHGDRFFEQPPAEHDGQQWRIAADWANTGMTAENSAIAMLNAITGHGCCSADNGSVAAKCAKGAVVDTSIDIAVKRAVPRRAIIWAL
jgi:hypothetical protein